MKPLGLTLLAFLVVVQFAAAQTSGLGSWNILNMKYNVHPQWSVFAETQLRSLKFYDHFHYYEYKGGVEYKLLPSVKLTLGAGSYQTYGEGGNFVQPQNNSEFRIWPQVVLNQTMWKLKVEQRYRAEFRLTSNGYRNRFRYRVGLALPLGKEREGYQPFQLGASNEIFFTNKEPYFERNRMLVTFSYKPSKPFTIQAGYLHQFDYRINDEIGRDFLQVGLYLEFTVRKRADHHAALP